METIKRQIRAAYDCLVAGQSPWARAWTAQRIGCTPALYVSENRRYSCSIRLVALYVSVICRLLPDVVWTFRPFVSLQSAGGRFRFLVPPSGTTFLSMHVACAPSLAVFRQRLKIILFFRSYQNTDIMTHVLLISIHHYCLDTCSPCNN